MPKGNKKSAAAGLNIEHVVEARKQAYNRINKWVCESKERRNPSTLSNETLYEHMPSLNAYDTLDREVFKKREPQQPVRGQETVVATEPQKEKKKKRQRKTKASLTMEDGIPQPVDYQPASRGDRDKGKKRFLKRGTICPPGYDDIMVRRVHEQVPTNMKKKCILPQIVVPSSGEDSPRSSPLEDIQMRNDHVFRSTAEAPPTEDRFWIRQDELPTKESPMSNKRQMFSNAVQTDEMSAWRCCSRGAGIARFRRVARGLTMWLRLFPHLMSDVSNDFSDTEKRKEFKDASGQVLTFNVNDFKMATRTYGGLSDCAKSSLAKLPTQRNDQDLTTLQEVTSRLSCFKKYNTQVKKELSRVLTYFRVKKKRVIIKQGYQGHYLYFVVSGAVQIYFRITNPDTGDQQTFPGEELRAGSMFGEQALFHNTDRQSTAIAAEDSELLCLSKTDFDTVLRTAYQQEWSNRLRILKNLSQFSNWTDNELHLCADTSTLAKCKENQIIVGNVTGPPKNMYFIHKGRCEVVREVVLVHEKLSPYMESALRLCASPSQRQRRQRTTRTFNSLIRPKEKQQQHYFSVGQLTKGDCFNVGENLEKTFVLSRGKSECLVVNPISFQRRNKKAELLEMKRQRESILPSKKEIFRNFMVGKRWSMYKEGLTKEIQGKKKIPNSTKLSDVPGVSSTMGPRL